MVNDTIVSVFLDENTTFDLESHGNLPGVQFPSPDIHDMHI